MALTLLQARAALLDHLDDDGTRWDSTAQDRALGWALSACTREYVGAGGSKLEIFADVSSDTSGLIDLSTPNPVSVNGLTLVVGSRHFQIQETKPEQRNILDDVSRTFKVRYTTTFVLPGTTSHPLIGSGAAAAATWDALDHWVIAKAAVFCSVKDAALRPELKDLESMARDAVMLDPAIPKSTGFPGPPKWYGSLLSWHWRPDLKKIQVCKRL